MAVLTKGEREGEEGGITGRMKIRERGDRWPGTPIRVFGGRGGRGIMGPSTVIGTGRGGAPNFGSTSCYE
jgi:hypothetical protein